VHLSYSPMARSLRIEYPGSVYHVINRGNYRQRIFSSDDCCRSFENTLFDACHKYDWILHAYCIMSNHYHLAIETVNGNLSVGMQWLQSTFANRFNKLRNVNGHLFQGRFKSLIVDKDEYLGPLLHYIHLNPVRARLVKISELPKYRWSSLWYLNNKHEYPDCLNISSCLYYAGDLADTAAGRSKYLEYLSWLSEDDQQQSRHKFEQMSRGWALGTKDFKKDLLKKHTSDKPENCWKGEDINEANIIHWENILDGCLCILKKSRRDVDTDKKSAVWKTAIAYYMKRHTSANNKWLSEQLNMGVAYAISKYASAFEKNEGIKDKLYEQLITRRKT